MNNFLEDLKKHFQSTSKEDILRVWEKSEKMDDVGITVNDFLKNMEHHYNFSLTPPNSEIKNSFKSNINPKFSSGFFNFTYEESSFFHI